MDCSDEECLSAKGKVMVTYIWNETLDTTTGAGNNVTTVYDNFTAADNSSITSNVTEEFQIGLIVLFSLTTVLSIVGNSFVVLVFSKGRHSRTDLRPFLINLAVADLVMAIFCMPFTFLYTMMNTWIFSKPMCPIVLYVQVLSVSASVTTNMAIGIDRFLAVTFPLRQRLTNKKAKYVIAGIWVCNAALSSVQFKVALTREYPNGQIECTESWPDLKARKIYTVSVFVITYVIPLLILSITYSIVGILLWKRTTPGNRDHARDMHQLRSKRKVVKMLVIVVAIFGICWLPLHLFTLILDFFPEVNSKVSMETLTSLFISCHWLAMSNSFANPIIYGFTNESFRADLVTLFYMWFPCCVFLTKMMPRHSSGSTYETVVYRRQSLYKQGAKINGTYQTRTVRAPMTKNYLHGHRNKWDYESISDVDRNKNKNGKVLNGSGSGQKVILTYDTDTIRLEPMASRHSISGNSEPSVSGTDTNKSTTTD